MDKLKEIYGKYRQQIVYLINGGLTTLVNFAVYIVFKHLFGIHELIANTIAWVIAVIYAFITNKVVVFRDRDNILKQFIMFAGLRVVSYGFEELSLWLFVTTLGFNDLIVKAVVAVVVVITNYVFSKFIIFKKK